MNLKRISEIFSGIMLGIFLFIILSAAGLKIADLRYKSYFAAFVIALLLFAVLYIIWKRLKNTELKPEPFKTGLVLSLICFAVSLGWVLYFRLTPDRDYLVFWNAATELAAGREITDPGYIAMFPHIMGYSVFLSLFLKLFGPYTMVAAVLNVILSCISGLIIYILCLRWGDFKTAVYAFILWIICPSRILYNTMVLSEPYYTCLLLCFLLIVSYLETKTENKKAGLIFYGLYGAAAGFILAALNTARPIAAVPIIAFFIWLLLLRGRELKNKEALKKWLSFALLLMLIYSLCGRSWNRYLEAELREEPASTPGYSIYVGFNPLNKGSYSKEDMELLKDYAYNVYGNSSDAQKQMLEEAKERISRHEISFPELFAVKLRTLLGSDDGGVYYSKKALSPGTETVLSLLSNAFYYLLIILVTLSTIKLIKKPGGKALLLVPLYVVGLSLAHMLVEVAVRYHYSVIPMFIIIAAFSLKSSGNGAEGDLNVT